MSKLNITPMEEWSGAKDRPLIIAGPCSAETEEQVMAIAEQLSKQSIDYYRAGIWKPRTRPGSFEGIGEEGLRWLKNIKETYGLKVGTEVATPQHVELALKYGIDALWIGARTTVNPFSVQDIADALQGADVPVLIKNPINPDNGLWVGAIERIAAAGITKIAAIHRGYSTHEKTRFRNKPMWQLAIELKRAFPEIPIINDPSHIAGTRDLIQEVSQSAMDIGLNGLMIETHCNPDEAWSDAKQQVTPDRLQEILASLKIRNVSSDNIEFNTSLEDLREQIDAKDKEIIDVLASRMNIAKQIGEYKRENNVTTLQMNRWEYLLQDRVNKASSLDLNDDFIREVFQTIHKESIKLQNEIMNNDKVNA